MKMIEPYNKKITKFSSRIIEMYIWLFIGLIIFLPEFLFMQRYYSIEKFLFEAYNKLLLSIGIVIFPILFKLIFGVLPIEAIRIRREEKSSIEKIHIKEQYTKEKEESLSNEDIKLNILELHLNEANMLAKKIYSRAGAYLLVGCLIAFAGIFIFYSPLFNNTLNNIKNPSYLDIIFNYLPRFGAMIFIEVIAFFFLNQYKIMMEEFRYYERIKRRREDNLAILNLVEGSKDEVTLNKILEHCVFEDSTTRELNENTTTELLELHKQNGDDLKVFDKIIDLTKAIKNK